MRTLTWLIPLLLIPFAVFAQQMQKQPLHFSQDYLWPTNASPYLSASFGETRAAHFHAALDIKTWGRKGYEVYATRDALLHRVGVWAVGYGHVVYLKHKDGTYSVYAHLEAFAPQLRELVDSLRMRDFSFHIDRIVENQNIRFEQGEVIGYSGATGIGPPHLHFELRTASQKPFNPLLTNLNIADSRSPRFEGLSVEPLGREALIEGKKQILTRRPRYKNGVYDFGTIDVEGKVGLGVNVFDLADRVSNAYAVYDLKLKKGDEILFHSRVDSFAYHETNQMKIDRVYPILEQTREGYQRLYTADGNSLPFYRKTDESGALNLENGNHRLTIIATDYYGNKSSGVVHLDVNNRSVTADFTAGSNRHLNPRTSGSITSTPDKSDIEEWYWENNWIAIPDKQGNTDYHIASANPFQSDRDVTALQVSDYRVIDTRKPLALTNGRGTGIFLHRIYPGQSRRIHLSDKKVFARFYASSLFDTASVALLNSPETDSSFDIIPRHLPLDDGIKVGYRPDSMPDNPRQWALYHYNKRKDKHRYLRTRIVNKSYTAETKHLGSFYLLEDTLQPTIQSPRLYETDYGYWKISVKVDDNLSGVDYGKARFFVNNQRGIPEYDKGNKRLIYYHPQFEPEDINNLRVILPDNVGNTAEKEFRVRK